MTLVKRISYTTEYVYTSCACNREAIYADVKSGRGGYMRDVDLRTSFSLFAFWRQRV